MSVANPAAFALSRMGAMFTTTATTRAAVDPCTALRRAQASGLSDAIIAALKTKCLAQAVGGVSKATAPSGPSTPVASSGASSGASGESSSTSSGPSPLVLGAVGVLVLAGAYVAYRKVTG